MIKCFNIKDTVNKAIRWVKANPCSICANRDLCSTKHKKTCKVRRQLVLRLHRIKEIGQDEV